MIIQKANFGDITGIKRIADESKPNVTAHPIWLYYILSVFSSTFVAKYKGIILGYLVFFQNPFTKSAFIYQFAVSPKYRKKGIATALLNKLGNVKISLGVRKFNKNALEFYKKRGFKLVSESFWFNKMYKLER